MKTIYALLQPATRQIRYVGSTSDMTQRMRVHWTSRFVKTSHVANWIRSLSEPPDYHVLQTVKDEVGLKAEDYWIDLLRQVPSVDLLNMKRSIDVRQTPRPRSIKKWFTEDQLEEIRNAAGSQIEIAKRYGVSHMTISRIKRGIR
jgi:hypothetical protein